MASTKLITCKCGCGRQKEVRVADIKRGWGKYFDKSCKARHQEKRTGQYARHLSGGFSLPKGHTYDGDGQFYDEYGNGYFNQAHLFSNEEHDCNKN
jgi:hypothetical protein